MPSTTEIARIAAAMNALRPAWRIDSLKSFLATHHEGRAYADLAIAGVWVALDEKTQTPALLNQHGPWWVAAGLSTTKGTPVVGPGAEPRCDRDGHEHELARACRCCRAERIAEGLS